MEGGEGEGERSETTLQPGSILSFCVKAFWPWQELKSEEAKPSQARCMASAGGQVTLPPLLLPPPLREGARLSMPWKRTTRHLCDDAGAVRVAVLVDAAVAAFVQVYKSVACF